MTERKAPAQTALLEPHELAELGPPEAVRLPLELIHENPLNPRKSLAEIDALADNIKMFGLLQPITVRRQSEHYELLGGHRRRAAFLLLRERFPVEVEWRTIPSVVRTMADDQSYLALISAQSHIVNWRPREQATALERLAITGMTLDQIGERLSRSGVWVSKRLRIYADSVLSGYVQTGRLGAAIAEELLTVLDVDTRRDLAERAVAEDWTQDHARGEVRALRIDRQLREIGRRAHELLELLASVDASRVPRDAADDLNLLSRRIRALATGQGPVLPSIEAAEKAAGVRTYSTRKRRAGYKPKL